MKNELPKRKSPKLKSYDYSSTGVYFVTICISERKRILSDIVKTNNTAVTERNSPDSIEEGLRTPKNSFHSFSVNPHTPPENDKPKLFPNSAGNTSFANNYKVRLTEIGNIAKEQLFALEERFKNLRIKDYVIMPDHIHILLYLKKEAGGASPSPTLHDVVCAYKSLTSRKCKQAFGIDKMFQRSFVEHIMRNREDYETKRKYIYENPMKWYYKKKNTDQ